MVTTEAMSAQVLLVAGLPGCGKTTYLQKLALKGWKTFDDFKANAHNDSTCFRDSRHYTSLVGTLRSGRKCAVSDIDFCRAESRTEAEQVLREVLPEVTLAWHFFENNPQQCAANIRWRNRPSLESDLQKLRQYSAVYSPPSKAYILPVLMR